MRSRPSPEPSPAAFTDDSVSAIRSQASRPGAHGRSRAIPATAVAALMLLNLPALAQQDADNETETVDGLMWSLVTNGESVPWNPANEFCETLEHAGFVDWRLPTLQELEMLHDASAENGMRAPFAIDDCCAWSSTSLEEIPAEAKGVLPEPSQAPSNYYWGFLFANGIRYYSFERFPDGLAMCVRDAAE